MNKVEKVFLDKKCCSDPILVAGNGSNGMSSMELNHPWGIFVDQDSTLYVAEGHGHRIQKFQQGHLNGEIVAGLNAQHKLTFNFPTDVYVDENGAVFVADDHNHRIIRITKENKWNCIVGCTRKKGADANQLNLAIAMQFDSHGNLFVADEANRRIQKFNLVKNNCSKCI